MPLIATSCILIPLIEDAIVNLSFPRGSDLFRFADSFRLPGNLWNPALYRCSQPRCTDADIPRPEVSPRSGDRGRNGMYNIQCSSSIPYSHTNLALGYYWLYLGSVNLLHEDTSCWTRISGHWNRRSCHRYPTTLCCCLPARISTSLRFGMPTCCDMAKCYWRVEFLPGC